MHDGGGCRVEAESPTADVSLFAVASFTVDGFLIGLSFLMSYDTDILGAIPFSAQFHYLKAAMRDLETKKTST